MIQNDKEDIAMSSVLLINAFAKPLLHQIKKKKHFKETRTTESLVVPF